MPRTSIFMFPWLPIFTVLVWAVLARILPAGSAMAAAFPVCAGPAGIADTRVARVEHNGTLVLPDGRAAVLEGIRLPRATPGLLENTVAPDVLAAIRTMTGVPVTFMVPGTVPGPGQDRYGRLRAQAFAGNTWLQVALLEKGVAQVDLAADRGECASQLYAAEARARAAHVGLWRAAPKGAPLPRFQVLGPQQMRGREGTFQIVEGRVTGVGRSGSRAFIDFGNDWRQGFSATIAPEDKKWFKGFDLDALVASSVRIRGIVQDYRGKPEIVLSSPAQIEILAGPAQRQMPAP